jgi:hypothetical protein
MDDARVSRMNLRLVVALVVAIALLAAAMFVMVQPILSHWIGGMLQGPGQMAGPCNGVPGPCCSATYLPDLARDVKSSRRLLVV